MTTYMDSWGMIEVKLLLGICHHLLGLVRHSIVVERVVGKVVRSIVVVLVAIVGLVVGSIGSIVVEVLELGKVERSSG